MILENLARQIRKAACYMTSCWSIIALTKDVLNSSEINCNIKDCRVGHSMSPNSFLLSGISAICMARM